MRVRAIGVALGPIVLFSLAAPAGCAGGGGKCRADADCPPGEHCVGGDCRYDCVHDSDCPGGFVCTARGRCQEMGCRPTNGGVEACDGVDNDCDEQTDEDVPPRDCPLQQGVCAGSRAACSDGAYAACDYGPDYTADVDDVCDGADNDCDGETDEDAAMVYQAELGAAAGDGVDNNCNGLVDEPGGLMVPVPQHPGTWIDAYEITVFANADCSGQRYGEAADDYPAGWPLAGVAEIELYACSLPGLLPSGHLSWHRARWACEAQGKRLCHSDEYVLTCNDAQGTWYPWGANLIPGVCNDPLGGAGHKVATGSYPECTAGNGAYDLCGNMAEWVENWNDYFPGWSCLIGWSYACEFILEDASIVSCADAGDEQLRYQDKIYNCDINRSYSFESYPRDGALPYFGTRCCYDNP
jgi:hypothetical protein